jgi:hypothetical protein
VRASYQNLDWRSRDKLLLLLLRLRGGLIGRRRQCGFTLSIAIRRAAKTAAAAVIGDDLSQKLDRVTPRAVVAVAAIY